MAPQSESSFERISQTAIANTYFRLLEELPYAEALYRLVDAETPIGQHIEENPTVLAPAALQVVARYKAVDHLLATSGCTQIVELASGLLTRGMSLSNDSSVTFIESDLPGMIARKKELATRLVGSRPNLHFESINAAAVPSQLPLAAAHLPAGSSIAVLCEGLLQYLTFEQKVQVAANVRELLQRFGGIWITPDLTTRENYVALASSAAAQAALQNAATGTGRNLMENAFLDVAHAACFFEEQGFRVEKHSLSEVADDLVCIERLGISSNEARVALLDVYIFALSLSNS